MNFSWDAILEKISTRISKPSFETWFQSTKAEIVGEKCIIFAPNSFAKDWIVNHYQQMIGAIVDETLGKHYELVFTVDRGENFEKIESPSPVIENKNHTPTFDSLFIQLGHIFQKQQEKIIELEKRIELLEKKE